MLKKCVAEFFGTMVLVLFGCGVAVVSEGNLVATALAFGLVIVAMAYSIGNISGCHVNPAVSFAMFLNKKLEGKEFFGYAIAQVLGAFAGSLLLALFTGGFEALGGNEVTAVLTGPYGAVGGQFIGLLAEVALTFAFLLAILGVTSRTENKAVTGIVIGLALTLVHLLGIGLTGTSVNPARSLAPAVLQMFAGEFGAISQIWIFIVGPFAGAAFAALLYRYLDGDHREKQSRR